MAKVRHSVRGHLYHGGDVAETYVRQPDRSMAKSGYVVHLRCIRTGCDHKITRRLPGVPRSKTDPVVSLPIEQQE